MYQRAWAAAIAVLCKQRLFVSLFLATAGLASAQTALAASDSAENPDQVIATDRAQAGADSASEGKAVATEARATVLPEMVVAGEVKRDTHYTSPSSRVTRADIERQNTQTTEEVLKYQPSLQIRQRSQWRLGYSWGRHVLDRAQHGLRRWLVSSVSPE